MWLLFYYEWHGVTLKFSKGPSALTYDYPVYDKLFVASLERATLENLMPSRMIDGEKRTIDQAIIEERLLMILNTRGEKGLNQFRTRTREIAKEFGWHKAFKN